MTHIRDPRIYTRTLRVFCCTDHAEGISLFCEVYHARGMLIARASWEDRPENYRSGRLIRAIVPGVKGVIGRSRNHEWDRKYPPPVPAILDELDGILRSRRADDFLTRFYRKYGRDGIPPLAPYSH